MIFITNLIKGTINITIYLFPCSVFTPLSKCCKYHKNYHGNNDNNDDDNWDDTDNIPMIMVTTVITLRRRKSWRRNNDNNTYLKASIMASKVKEFFIHVPTEREKVGYTVLLERWPLLHRLETMGMFHAAASSATGWHTTLQVAPMMPSRSGEVTHASTAILTPGHRRKTQWRNIFSEIIACS